MARLHTLTYNETTYNINDDKTTNDIYINGEKSDWYIEHQLRDVKPVATISSGIKLKNRNDEDEDTETYYLYLDTTTLQFNDIIYIIKTIRND